jgi:hypothetical protein
MCPTPGQSPLSFNVLGITNIPFPYDLIAHSGIMEQG